MRLKAKAKLTKAKFYAWRLLLRLVWLEREYLRRIRRSVWLYRLTHSHLLSFSRHALCRGLAIGMFWAFIPMPFQMVPAALFCWLGLANLPVALLAVWISNPITYLPIFFAEYHVALWLGMGDAALGGMNFEKFIEEYENIGKSLSGIYLMILKGAIVLGTLFAILGYFAGYPISTYIQSFNIRRWRKRKSAD